MTQSGLFKPAPFQLTPHTVGDLIAFHHKTFGAFRMEDDAGAGGDRGAAGGDASGQDSEGGNGDQGGQQSDLGFPANTPVAQMSVDQQAAYWRHQAKRHEQRATAYHTAVGGKSADDVKADLERLNALQRETLSDHEKALADKERETREATAREFGTKSVRTAFELALRALPDQERRDFIDDLDLSKFLTDSGDVDTAKVLTRAEKIAPAVKDTGTSRLDFGGGNRGNTRTESGVAAGRAAYVASKRPTTT